MKIKRGKSALKDYANSGPEWPGAKSGGLRLPGSRLIWLGMLALNEDFHDETMKSGQWLHTQVAARLGLCHKSYRFSAVHHIWRLDNL